MVSKVGTGPSAHLICSDCGLPRRDAVKGISVNPLGQLISVLLIAGIAVTAVGLMVLKDHQSPSLMDEQGMELNQSREEGIQRRRRWVVVPGTPGSTLGR
jgi:hypothetical protein